MTEFRESNSWTSFRLILDIGCRNLAAFKVRVLLSLPSFFPLADSNPSPLRALMDAHGRKTRTLHKNREECGTR